MDATEVQQLQATAPSVIVPIGQAMTVGDPLARESASKSAGVILSSQPQSSKLLQFLRDNFSDAERSKQSSGAEESILESLRRRKGKYKPETLAQLAKWEIPAVWFPHTRIKCELKATQIRDALTSDFWVVEPPEIPSLDKATEQRIATEIEQDAAEAMAEGVDVDPAKVDAQKEDQRVQVLAQIRAVAGRRAKIKQAHMQEMLERGNFMRVLRDAWQWAIDTGTGFIHGPIARTKKIRTSDGKVASIIIGAFETFSPLDAYPAPWSLEVTDGPFFRRMPLERHKLVSFIGKKYWQEKQIKELLLAHPRGNMQSLYSDTERPSYENRDSAGRDERLDCRYCIASIPGYMLADWGLTDLDPTGDYSVETVHSGDKILMVRPNWDQLETPSIFKWCFKRMPGSFWGESEPTRIAAGQDKGNFIEQCQMAEAEWLAQPERFYRTDMFCDPKDAESRYPGKKTAVKQPLYQRPGDNGRPCEIVEQADHLQSYEMIRVRIFADIDLQSGAPAFMQGSDKAAGAGRTYSGLVKLSADAQKGNKDALEECDLYALGPSLQSLSDWLSENADDPELGIEKDQISMRLRCKAQGASGLLLREQQIEKIGILLDKFLDPRVMATTGPGVYIDLLRQFTDLLRINLPSLPSEEELAKNSDEVQRSILMNMWAQMTPAMGGGGGGGAAKLGAPASDMAPANAEQQPATEGVQ